MTALTETDWQDYLNRTPRAVRALGIVQDQWQDVVMDNPLFITQITAGDLKYADQLVTNNLVEPVRLPLATYAQRQTVRRHYSTYLTADAVTWLNRSQQ
ncbi:hypothetical protein ACRYI5_10035 [Furfurilactobacillus sp. WILCCON 0119]